jgi:hypothetical protein
MSIEHDDLFGLIVFSMLQNITKSIVLLQRDAFVISSWRRKMNFVYLFMNCEMLENVLQNMSTFSFSNDWKVIKEKYCYFFFLVFETLKNAYWEVIFWIFVNLFITFTKKRFARNALWGITLSKLRKVDKFLWLISHWLLWGKT